MYKKSTVEYYDYLIGEGFIYTHADAAVDPVPDVVLPVPQDVQDAGPVASLYSPAGQIAHDVPP